MPPSTSRQVATSKMNNPRGGWHPRSRRAAGRLGSRLSPTSKPLMPPASSTAARSHPTTRPGSAIGSRGSPRAKGWCRLHLLARRLQPHSSRLFDQQSEPFKTSSQTSTPPTSSLQAKLKTSVVGADRTKKSMRWPLATQSLCIGLRSLSAGAGPITQR